MDKMKIFISWSGARSAAVAEVLKEYLPLINNSFEPWLSSEDIPKGSRSTSEIADALANARAGIICLTPNNLTAPWILFEAGGIAKTVTEKPLACTLLIGLEPSQVSKPLGDFQATRLKEKEPLPESAGLLRLIRTLNKALGDSALPEARQEKAFTAYWPELKERLDLNKLPPDGPMDKAERTPEDMLAEILDTLRSTTQQDSALLNQALAGIASILAKIPSPAPTQIFAAGSGKTHFLLSDLLDPQSGSSGFVTRFMGPNYASHSGSDASTSGNEPPPVPPELLETKSNQPVSKPRPAPQREKKASQVSRKPRGTE